MPLFRVCIYCEDLFCHLIIIDGSAWFEQGIRYFGIGLNLSDFWLLKEEWADSVT